MLGLSFMGILGFDLIGSNSSVGMISQNLISTSQAQTLEEPCPPCGPLMGNESGTRYCCADTNSDYCPAAKC
ncbi:hypothetical protein SAMN04487988_10580 [Algoriphagus hitonicola]|uniref:Uncharacterized protein n=2 Tax=Algoriphagus hitonicola TaxID=435880 RepID=A0A1I2SZZ0_9BACT|nr:hypothetical protein SAMN04487988_10580 [Algoriphagus hitonicola]